MTAGSEIIGEKEMTVKAQVTKSELPDRFNVGLARIVDGKIFPLTNLKNLTGSDVYVKTGIITPKPKMEATEINEKSKLLIQEAMKNFGGQTLLSRSVVDDLLLDIQNLLESTVKDGTDSE